ncbi:MAG: hypothetical protein R6U40_02905, partial [Desulfobacterales bacterium]
MKPNRTQIETFKSNILQLFNQINEQESEEHHKNIIRTFLRETWYSPGYYINTKGRIDLVIHNSKDATSAVGVLLETKKSSNKTEMPTKENLNAKAMHELMLYYLRERIAAGNKDIKHLIITNIHEWFVFDAQEFYRLFAQNKTLVKQFTEFNEGRTEDTRTDYFYNQIAKPFLDDLETEITFTYTDIRDFEKIIRNSNPRDDNKLVDSCEPAPRPCRHISGPQPGIKRPSSSSLYKPFPFRSGSEQTGCVRSWGENRCTYGSCTDMQGVRAEGGQKTFHKIS